MKYDKRKPIRLDKHLYQGPLTISVTLCCYQNYDVVNAGLANKIIEILNQVVMEYSIDNYVYCLMPDHLHLLLGLSNDKHNVLDIVKHFKSKTAFKLKGKYTTKQLWQDRFYDHILRKEEDIHKQARYILENPIRKGLIVNFAEYPLSGGIYFNDLVADDVYHRRCQRT